MNIDFASKAVDLALNAMGLQDNNPPQNAARRQTMESPHQGKAGEIAHAIEAATPVWSRSESNMDRTKFLRPKPDIYAGVAFHLHVAQTVGRESGIVMPDDVKAEGDGLDRLWLESLVVSDSNNYDSTRREQRAAEAAMALMTPAEVAKFEHMTLEDRWVINRERMRVENVRRQKISDQTRALFAPFVAEFVEAGEKIADDVQVEEEALAGRFGLAANHAISLQIRKAVFEVNAAFHRPAGGARPRDIISLFPIN